MIQANDKYIPWIKNYDPYDLPMGVSEGSIYRGTDVDIEFSHQTDRFPKVDINAPTIMNELVGGWSESLWKDSTIRDSDNRLGYRRTFWRMFTYGGSGCIEASDLYITPTFNQAVFDVMNDQMRFRELIEDLPCNINEMETVSRSGGPGDSMSSDRIRKKDGECYVIYFSGDFEENINSGSVNVDILAGDYNVSFYNPKTGVYETSELISHLGGIRAINYPDFSEDIVLLVKATNLFIINPPTNLVATAVSESQIDLTWNDNSNNEEGFKIERKEESGGEFNEIDSVGSNVKSYSDIGLNLDTTYLYRIRAYESLVYSDYSNEDNAITFGGVILNEDVDESGYVDIDDMVWAGPYFGRTNCDEIINNWCDRADVTRDGKVSIIDFVSVGLNFN